MLELRRPRHPRPPSQSGCCDDPLTPGALIGFMGLVLAFGLSPALGRYESRRADTVDEANTIGTTYLRAQTPPGPVRGEPFALLPRSTRTSIAISETVPGSPAEERAL